MKPSRSPLAAGLLKLACAALLLGSAAQARNEACEAASNRASGTCVARVVAVDAREPAARGEAMAVGGAKLALWQPERRSDTGATRAPLSAPDAERALPSTANEPPLLGLLLAALGVVGFVAHRRGGR